MDELQQAALARAKGAIELLSTDGPAGVDRARADAFRELAFVRLLTPGSSLMQTLSAHPNAILKAAAHSTLTEDWDAPLAAAFVASVAEFSLLDRIKRYARVLPAGQTRAMLASGFTTSTVAEAAPKVVRRLGVNFSDVEATKVATIVVMTKELAMAAGGAGQRLFEQELTSSLMAATNVAVLAALTDSSTIEIGSTSDGDDPLDALRVGLAAAGPSMGYVCAVSTAYGIDLATRVENRGGMSPRGGTFVPGIEIVVVGDISGLRVIPASRLAMFDTGLELRSAEHASISMSDSPSAPSTLVSLWQTGSIGLIAERGFHLAGDAQLVSVGATS